MPLIRRILHPTDFSPESTPAFHHALALALGGELNLLHIGEESWKEGPHILPALDRWERSEQVKVRKLSRSGSPVEATLEEAVARGVDLVVMRSHRRTWWSWLLAGSHAEAVARGWPTLIVPDGVRGFIDSNTGENRLSTVLVPLDPSEDASPVLDALKLVLGKGPGTIKILNVGEQTSVMGLPEGWKLEYLLREGEPLEEILKELAAAPDLVVMGSRGHDSLKDTLLGSKAEQVLHAVDCPVLISQLVA